MGEPIVPRRNHQVQRGASCRITTAPVSMRARSEAINAAAFSQQLKSLVP
jgi:hypothetical protein